MPQEKKKVADLYKAAFFSNALLLIHDLDLTEDSITEPITAYVYGEPLSLLEMLGMEPPCRYSDFIQQWAEQKVGEADREKFLADFDRNGLLRRFYNGETSVQVDYRQPGKAVLRHFITMCQNDAGHVVVQDIMQDVSGEERLCQELEDEREENRRLRYTDPLTGFLNKQGFLQAVREILKRDTDCPYGLCYSDVNHLSYVNSMYGYDVGNRLLQVWSQFIHDHLHSGDVLGRISGDYFAILVNMADLDSKTWLENLHHAGVEYVNGYFQEEYPHFHVDIYCGVYTVDPSNKDKLSVERMINRAAIAQKNAKEQGGKAICFYNEEQWNKRSRAIRISQNLEEAIDNGHLVPWFQPQYDYKSGKLIGAEVLCRWHDPELGWISPAEFVPVLEDTGQIYVLDSYIWEQACQCIRKWLDVGGYPAVPLSINISRRDIQEEDLANRLPQLLERYGLTPDMLRLEITESAYMDEPEMLVDIVQTLRDLNFTVEMDDFGSGYSSLSMLKEVPVDILKMDLRFLSETGTDRRGGSIISSVIRMAQGLNIAVIAEGVETATQAESIKNMGCYIMQGFYFGKPMPLAEFEKVLEATMVEKSLPDSADQGLAYIYDIMDNNSKSAYIFNHYSSAEAVLEFDGENMEVMCINDEFLRVIGDPTGAMRKHMKDGLGLVKEEHRPRALEALRRAVRDGRAECEVFLPETQQWVSVTYRHVLQCRTINYLFCEAINTTERHAISDQMNRIMNEISLMPAGFIRYTADEAQEFNFISDGVLNLLGYTSEEAFRKKFHNRFPDMVWHEDRGRVLKEIEDQTSGTGVLDSCVYRIEMGNGQLKWVYDRGHLVTDESGKKWFYVVIVDLDQFRQNQHNGN